MAKFQGTIRSLYDDVWEIYQSISFLFDDEFDPNFEIASIWLALIAKKESFTYFARNFMSKNRLLPWKIYPALGPRKLYILINFY